MKILEVNKFNFSKGGADKHFLDVCDLLENDGHEVARFCMHHPDNLKSPWEKYFISSVGYTEEYSFWQKIKGVGRMFYSWEAKMKMEKLLDDFNPDTVHLHNIYHQISPSILIPIKKRKIPVLMTVHDYEWVSPDREEFFSTIGGRYWKFIFIKKYNLARRILLVAKKYFHRFFGFEAMIDAYISPSQYVKKILMAAGISEKKITANRHFIPEENSVTDDEINGVPKEKYAFYFGRLSREKGVDVLIDLFRKENRLKLYLAGKEERGFVVSKNPKITRLGFLDRRQIKSFIRGSQYVVCASRLSETFGLIALESIAEGKPFIALKTGAYSEIITNGKNGYLCDSHDDLDEILNQIDRGKIVFDEKTIQLEALKNFGTKNYREKLISILKNAKKYES